MVLNTDKITPEGTIVKSEIASFAVPIRHADQTEWTDRIGSPCFKKG